MSTDLVTYSATCDFCSKRKSFKNCKQVVLKIDKNNNYQFLFGIICSSCQKKNVKQTVHGQTIKLITNRNHHKDEISLFDENEEIESE